MSRTAGLTFGFLFGLIACLGPVAAEPEGRPPLDSCLALLPNAPNGDDLWRVVALTVPGDLPRPEPGASVPAVIAYMLDYADGNTGPAAQAAVVLAANVPHLWDFPQNYAGCLGQLSAVVVEGIEAAGGLQDAGLRLLTDGEGPGDDGLVCYEWQKAASLGPQGPDPLPDCPLS